MNLAESQKQKIYLNKINAIQNKRLIYKKSKLRKTYISVVNNEKELIEYLKQPKQQELYFGLFYHLVTSGFLSVNNTFQKNTSCIELTLEPGISIINGSGCCRNLSAHFNTIMNLVNQNQKFVLAGTNYIIQQAKFNHNSSTKEPTANIKNLLLPNHMESFDINTNTLYDPLNFRIQSFDINDQSEEYYIGLIDLAFDTMINMNIEEQQHSDILIKLLQYSRKLTTSKRTFYQTNELLKLQEQCADICNKNINVIKFFQDKVKPKQKYIINETLRYQKNNY